jgi:hypothetical protein
VALTSSHLTQPQIFPFLPFRLQDRQETWGTLLQATSAVIIATIWAPDLSAAFLDKERMYTAGEAIVWAAALGPECAARAAPVARPFALLATWAAPSTFKFDGTMTTKFLMRPFF